ncbi:hypothetical protein DCAR_0310423 [Daucus carota subsp. sativus]|uniref:Uncharacterized protein n=1 Tax=Daucus carota subsp. sativus TaxID=79200 RepID=A0A165ZUY0_DAUCS|nr:PREDICTED: uncharacterized protein LOC108212112 [Daucus carota subsp. sativus]XP_017239333.1 PREDICTED: uncharacterized protein LOC108212113 [Daucus carota subsp. sativus]WOG91175.1 hypothetical protein DCAR_0310423 [Daucus carota subsp. sativus]
MATSYLPFRATTVRSAFRNHDSSRTQKTSNPKWWAPLVSWSSEPDYFDSDLSAKAEAKPETTEPIKSRIAPGSFTEEKARKLRLMTKDTAFHDAMYHSVIASRLAFDSNDRSDF